MYVCQELPSVRSMRLARARPNSSSGTRWASARAAWCCTCWSEHCLPTSQLSFPSLPGRDEDVKRNSDAEKCGFPMGHRVASAHIMTLVLSLRATCPHKLLLVKTVACSVFLSLTSVDTGTGSSICSAVYWVERQR